MKKQNKFSEMVKFVESVEVVEDVELVESGDETTIIAAIPVRDIKEKKVAPCRHTFSRKEIIDFTNGDMDQQDMKALKKRINSCIKCQDDARQVARSEGVEDAFIEQMGW